MSPTILVVDDNPDSITILQSILETRGYGVLVAESGQEALRVANGVQRPDLVLLDVMMPEMNGLEVLQKL